jgi:hypothetical protein
LILSGLSVFVFDELAGRELPAQISKPGSWLLVVCQLCVRENGTSLFYFQKRDRKEETYIVMSNNVKLSMKNIQVQNQTVDAKAMCTTLRSNWI